MAQDSRPRDRARRVRPDTAVAIAASSYHAQLSGAMAESAQRELVAAGVDPARIRLAWAPGAFELPLLARRLGRAREIDAVLCFGVVLRGETAHDEHVARGACEGIARVMLELDKPVLLGVLTCQTLEQARARALAPEDGGSQDKGREVARAALDLLASLEALEEDSARPVGLPQPAAPSRIASESDILP